MSTITRERFDEVTRKAVAATSYAMRAEIGSVVGNAARGTGPSLAGVDIFELVVGTAWQMGFEDGVRLALVDRLGGEEVAKAIDAFVHEGDEECLSAGRVDARRILEELLR